MKNEEGLIIYVGKARSLRARLSSYFSGEKDIKTRTLLRRAASIETIIVKDEYEALLLENTLIKQHSPKYNINLKDGKTYPVIRLTPGPYPRLFRTRHIVNDGSSYFGPFPNAGAMDDMLEVIGRIFPLRKCRVFKKRGTAGKNRSPLGERPGAGKSGGAPCMYYHIGRCSAPCCGKTTEAAYALQVDRVRRLLSGDAAELIAELSAEMRAAAAALRFERAAQLRDAVKAIEGLGESSAVVDFDPQGRDYIAWAAEGMLATFSVFSMRGGKLTGRELYRTKSAAGEEESLGTFITEYYNGERPPPAYIYAQNHGAPREAGGDPETGGEAPKKGDPAFDKGNLLKWFREQFGAEPALLPAGDSHHRAILAMARQNAEEDLRRRLKERGAGPALDELKTILGLKNRPARIEGFDIAQLDGKHPVASLVSFANGAPDKKNYRRFKLRSVAGVVDDFGALREAVERRYTRLLRENREPPDLILIDGGIGQVNAVKGVLDKLGITCGLAGLAKREEEIWLPWAAGPLRLSRRSEALKVLQSVRDESHRFATSLNQLLRSKDLRLEALESVEGIGPRRAAALLRHYLSVEAVAAAEPGDISRVCGCGSAPAAAVRAAARLALEERKSPPPRGRASGFTRPGAAAALAEAALAAEAEPEYGGPAPAGGAP
jgi:excinuclease ABC subunit C